MVRNLAIFVILGTGLSSCTQFPELDAAVDPAVYEKPYPELVPLEQLVISPPRDVGPAVQSKIQSRAEALKAKATGAGVQLDAASAAALRRADALRARAARLNTPVIDRATRNRMAKGVPR